MRFLNTIVVIVIVNIICYNGIKLNINIIRVILI